MSGTPLDSNWPVAVSPSCQPKVYLGNRRVRVGRGLRLKSLTAVNKQVEMNLKSARSYKWAESVVKHRADTNRQGAREIC
jgi:hypothetical protein